MISIEEIKKKAKELNHQKFRTWYYFTDPRPITSFPKNIRHFYDKTSLDTAETCYFVYSNNLENVDYELILTFYKLQEGF
jgi:hypothetical protein